MKSKNDASLDHSRFQTFAAMAVNRLLPWLLLFVGSGCAALIYEIVWFQLLQLVIGLTNVSLGLLLGIFMGGMCLGSLLLPRLISPKHHPLRVYALLETDIAVIGVAILFVLPWVSALYTAHAGRGLSGVLLGGLLAALVFSLFIVPTYGTQMAQRALIGVSAAAAS